MLVNQNDGYTFWLKSRPKDDEYYESVYRNENVIREQPSNNP